MNLKQRWNPRQLSNRLRADFPGQPEMHVVPETVYQALYGRGSLDLAVDPAVSLRSGRPGGRPRRRNLGVHSREHLAMVAAELNRRPREILGWQSLMEHLARLASPSTDS